MKILEQATTPEVLRSLALARESTNHASANCFVTPSILEQYLCSLIYETNDISLFGATYSDWGGLNLINKIKQYIEL